MASFGFGTTANTQSSAGTLFGAPATSAPTGFGTSANTNAAGTLFGANTTNSSAAGTLFGGSATATTPASTGFGGFGATSTAPTTGGFGGFGATSTAPATGGFGGFGATSQPATSTAGTTGFGGFGTTPATSTAGTTGFGGFGTTPATSTAGTTGFGGFGTTPTTSTAGTTGFGGFGTTPATSTAGTTGFGGFGTTPATSTAGTTGFGGFGTTPATSTAGTTGFGGFGTTPATSTAGTTGFGGFGANTNAAKPATGFGGFGATNTTNTTGGMFGAKPATGFGTGFGTQPATGFGAQQPQQPAPVQEKVWQDLALIRAHFDPTSPLCQFRHYFYNMVPSNEVHLYVRPPNQDEQLWNEAVRKNPDPANFVPVLAVGFDDILKRMEIQNKQVELHQEKLKETEERLKTAQRQYNLGTLVKLEEHKRRHIYLTQRLLRLLRYSQVLRYKGFPLTAEEEQSMNELNQLASDSNNPEQLNAKMISLWNQLQSIKAKKTGDGQDKVEVWRTVNEEDTRVIAKVLSDYQQGIKHITTILKQDSKDLETIENGLRGKRKSSESYISH